MSRAASRLGCAAAASAGSDSVASVDDSAAGFHADASNAETGRLARSSHGARSMGASNEGEGTDGIPGVGAAGASSAYRISSSA
ncbi:hypothetical protein [Burkholderia cepacia]|uniref:hypothetical protein n=1 Tax=Burkholderia cepacia TaxID=292 RepID=UPI003A5C3645